MYCTVHSSHTTRPLRRFCAMPSACLDILMGACIKSRNKQLNGSIGHRCQRRWGRATPREPRMKKTGLCNGNRLGIGEVRSCTVANMSKILIEYCSHSLNGGQVRASDINPELNMKLSSSVSFASHFRRRFSSRYRSLFLQS